MELAAGLTIPRLFSRGHIEAPRAAGSRSGRWRFRGYSAAATLKRPATGYSTRCPIAIPRLFSRGHTAPSGRTRPSHTGPPVHAFHGQRSEQPCEKAHLVTTARGPIHIEA